MGDVEGHTRTHHLTVAVGGRGAMGKLTQLIVEASIPQTGRRGCINTKTGGIMLPYNIVEDLQEEGKRRKGETQRAVLQR